jgi:hypothetical protein
MIGSPHVLAASPAIQKAFKQYKTTAGGAARQMKDDPVGAAVRLQIGMTDVIQTIIVEMHGGPDPKNKAAIEKFMSQGSEGSSGESRTEQEPGPRMGQSSGESRADPPADPGAMETDTEEDEEVEELQVVPAREMTREEARQARKAAEAQALAEAQATQEAAEAQALAEAQAAKDKAVQEAQAKAAQEAQVAQARARESARRIAEANEAYELQSADAVRRAAPQIVQARAAPAKVVIDLSLDD